jgi:hypothetical protein
VADGAAAREPPVVLRRFGSALTLPFFLAAAVLEDADGSAREASVVDEKPRVRRLPESAPFRRVFGLWRDDHCFYPGEIEWASPGSRTVGVLAQIQNAVALVEAAVADLRRAQFARVRVVSATTISRPTIA